MANRYFESEEHTKLYQQFRLTPPTPLIERVVQFLKEKCDEELNTAVDVGCGSGQNTFCYADHFKAVIGMDISPNQIALANEHNDRDNVVFRVSPAENMADVADESVHLVTAMASLHWFDLDSFFKEVNRVLRPSGVLAVYIYGTNQTTLEWKENPGKNEQLNKTYKELRQMLLPFTPSQNQMARDNYRSITLPFEDVVREEDTFFDERPLTLAQHLGRLQTASSFQLMKQSKGSKAADEFLEFVRTKFLDALFEDSTDPNRLKSPDDIEFIQHTPFILLMARKGVNKSS